MCWKYSNNTCVFLQGIVLYLITKALRRILKLHCYCSKSESLLTLCFQTMKIVFKPVQYKWKEGTFKCCIQEYDLRVDFPLNRWLRLIWYVVVRLLHHILCLSSTVRGPWIIYFLKYGSFMLPFVGVCVAQNTFSSLPPKIQPPRPLLITGCTLSSDKHYKGIISKQGMISSDSELHETPCTVYMQIGSKSMPHRPFLCQDM